MPEHSCGGLLTSEHLLAYADSGSHHDQALPLLTREDPVEAGGCVFAHCLRARAGGVGVLAINTDKTVSRSLTLPTAGERYTLSSSTVGNLQEKRVQLNGTELKLSANDDLPPLAGESIGRGDITLAPATVTFLAFPEAANTACR